jgi:voltage-gated potassium channel
MNTILYLILRRMRAPLLVVITVYAVAVLGFVLLPSTDDQGNPWNMDFFHAFYFVSYMATTIGFGEIPYEFSVAQRMWTVLCTYLTVIAWVYALGNLLTLVQDPALRQAFIERHFTRLVRGLREPFYLVCGYGDTGSALVGALAAQNHRCVVVDIDPDRMNALMLMDYPVFVPGLCADAGLPNTLNEAGLRNRHCAGVIALTNKDEVNLHIAIASKLFRPKLQVICRAESEETEGNMASFGTDHIVDPFETFAERLFTALHAPCRDTLHEWLTGNSRLRVPLNPPHGLWVLCGYGRFGKALHRRLEEEGVATVIVEATPEATGWPEGHPHCVRGWGTEAVTLREARIHEAVGVVAGTNHDTNNLSILMTARDLNPTLFVVARQNRQHNRELFAAVHADIVMQASRAIGDRIRTLLGVPMLADFLQLVSQEEEDWARTLTVRLASLLGDEIPETWEVQISEEYASAVDEILADGGKVLLGDLMRDPRSRTRTLVCAPLLLWRKNYHQKMPGADLELQRGDRLLFCGAKGSAARMHLALEDPIVLHYLCTGREDSQSYVWRWLGWRHRSATDASYSSR